MTVEVAMLISFVSVAWGIYQGVLNLKRNQINDTKNDTAQLTTIIVKLENIGDDISEIKNDMGNVKHDMKDMNARLIKAEQQLKVLNKTIFKNGDSNE